MQFIQDLAGRGKKSAYNAGMFLKYYKDLLDGACLSSQCFRGRDRNRSVSKRPASFTQEVPVPWGHMCDPHLKNIYHIKQIGSCKLFCVPQLFYTIQFSFSNVFLSLFRNFPIMVFFFGQGGGTSREIWKMFNKIFQYTYPRIVQGRKHNLAQ